MTLENRYAAPNRQPRRELFVPRESKRPDLAQLLPPVLHLARAAGAGILTHYTPEIAVRRKEDASPVTAADEDAEELILAGLRQLTPDIPIISEEAFARGEIPAIVPPIFWLVDPLDGTKEFLNGNGEFTVNIALVEGECPVLGVVTAPALGLSYTGAGVGSAQEWRGSAERRIAVRSAPLNGVTVIASRSHGTAEMLEAFLRGRRVSATREAGSSLKFCLIAAGEADLYPRFGRTMEWDTAAGQAVLAAAGGRVRTLDGTEMRYGKRGFENPHFIASAD
jgi:3'(2'), 5'-bisphosphate nucleotidase